MSSSSTFGGSAPPLGSPGRFRYAHNTHTTPPHEYQDDHAADGAWHASERLRETWRLAAEKRGALSAGLQRRHVQTHRPAEDHLQEDGLWLPVDEEIEHEDAAWAAGGDVDHHWEGDGGAAVRADDAGDAGDADDAGVAEYGSGDELEYHHRLWQDLERQRAHFEQLKLECKARRSAGAAFLDNWRAGAEARHDESAYRVRIRRARSSALAQREEAAVEHMARWRACKALGAWRRAARELAWEAEAMQRAEVFWRRNAVRRYLGKLMDFTCRVVTWRLDESMVELFVERQANLLVVRAFRKWRRALHERMLDLDAAGERVRQRYEEQRRTLSWTRQANLKALRFWSQGLFARYLELWRRKLVESRFARGYYRDPPDPFEGDVDEHWDRLQRRHRDHHSIHRHQHHRTGRRPHARARAHAHGQQWPEHRRRKHHDHIHNQDHSYSYNHVPSSALGKRRHRYDDDGNVVLADVLLHRPAMDELDSLWY